MSAPRLVPAVCCVLLAGAAVAAPPVDLALDVGTQRVVSLSPGARVSEVKPGAVEVKRFPRGPLVLVGVKPGAARFTVTEGKKTTAYRVTVRAFDERRATAEVRALLGEVQGASFGFNKGCLWFECPTCTPEENNSFEGYLALHPCVKSPHPSPAQPDLAAVLAGVRAALGEGEDDTPGLLLDVRDGQVVVTGEAVTDDDVQRLARVRRAWPSVKVRVRTPELGDGPR